jgi:hypothetical protein
MRVIRDNGLTIVLLGLTIATVAGMFLTGWQVNNEEVTQHGGTALSLATYALSGHFLSAIFENWESEFLQMSAYVMLTAVLFQRGSAESKDPNENASQDEDPASRAGQSDAPWAVRAGGWTRALYSYSLGIALALLFVASFILHLRYSACRETQKPPCTASRRSRSCNISPAHSSGSNRFRTGNPNFCRRQ